uniref:Sec-independent protein translocase protein n=1 Tax=Cyanidiococcus yangmingshanensis TaxID=2690220 RepID=A0A7H0WBE5_9RHOD|nr:Sec-independent protein translocase protein [Cyanidiococcus yangmingshanensis]UNJ18933.1 Sec-independent protein translocase protein [Cyanidioschyzonaceae sp. 2 FvB-2021]
MDNSKPIELYLRELKYRFYYFIFSLLLCIILVLYKMDTILFIILANLPKKELIATEIYEIFISYIIIITNLSLLFCYPLLVYNLFSFFCNAWTIKEKKIFLYWIIIINCFLLNNFFLTYSFLIPTLSLFFYNIEQLHNNFAIRYEIKIINFIYWFFNNLLSFMNIYIFPLSLVTFFKFYQIVKSLKVQRRYFLTLNLLISFVLSPDILSQVIILFLLSINYETFVLIIILKKINIIKSLK